MRELGVFAESKAGLVKKARKLPWYSHVDRSLIGNLYQFMADFEGELDEIETDMVSEGRDVIRPWEKQRVADDWAGHFEQELEAHWTTQAKQRRPVLVEPAPPAPCRDGAPGAQAQVDGRPGNGQKIWASAWTRMPDVAYNLACFQVVTNGFVCQEVIAAAEKGRDEVRKPE